MSHAHGDLTPLDIRSQYSHTTISPVRSDPFYINETSAPASKSLIKYANYEVRPNATFTDAMRWQCTVSAGRTTLSIVNRANVIKWPTSLARTGRHATVGITYSMYTARNVALKIHEPHCNRKL